jgi:phage-related protein
VWPPFDETTPVKWTCEKWSDTVQNDRVATRTVTATFQQCFNLVT